MNTFDQYVHHIFRRAGQPRWRVMSTSIVFIKVVVCLAWREVHLLHRGADVSPRRREELKISLTPSNDTEQDKEPASQGSVTHVMGCDIFKCLNRQARERASERNGKREC